MKNILELKQPEIDCLCRLAGVATDPYKVSSLSELVETKNLLMRKIKQKAVEDIKYPITNFANEVINYQGFNFFYKYIRQNNKFLEEDLSSIFYPTVGLKLGPNEIMGHFTVNAQGTMSATLNMLKSLYPHLKVETLGQKLYFETLGCIENLIQADGPDILIIDSSAQDTSVYNQECITKADLIIFDTTCFYFNDSELARIMQLCFEANRPTFCIRSCIKLDSLGVEYASLGSFFAFNLDHLPSFSEKAFEKVSVKSVQEYITQYLSFHGMLASLDHFYPFYWDKELIELNASRVSRIKENFNGVEEFISCEFSNLKVSSFGHKLFALVYLEDKVEDYAQKIKNIQKRFNLPLYNANSFGFDFMNAEQFKSYGDQEQFFLRITSHDLGEDYQKISLKMIKSLLKK